MTPNDSITPVEVYTGSVWEAELLRSILEDSGIYTHLQNSNLATIAPFQAAAGGAGPVSVVVSSTDVENALLIIEEFERNRLREDEEV